MRPRQSAHHENGLPGTTPENDVRSAEQLGQRMIDWVGREIKGMAASANGLINSPTRMGERD
jgi:hypothetical protein